MIQPAGLGGTPVEGHRCTATAKASWTASSARSMSPKCRTRTATARPYSSRNTRSIVDVVRSGTGFRLALQLATEWSDFHGQAVGLAWQNERARQPSGPFERGVQILRLENQESADVLFALDERAVRGQQVAALDPNNRGGAGGMKPSVEHPYA